MARPIFADFISRLEKDPKSGYDYNARFVRPPGDLGIETNCAAYESNLRVLAQLNELRKKYEVKK